MNIVKELRILAKGRNIKGYSKMRKTDLFRVLNLQPPTKPPTMKDLRKIAKEKNIKGYYKMKKIDLIGRLRKPIDLNHEKTPTVKDLQKIAKEKNIKKYYKMK